MREYLEVMPNGRTMRGWVGGDDTELEFGVIEHAMPDGSVMREAIIRPVAPPAPAHDAQQKVPADAE
ncbi:hypothetical protein [Siccirubricoccus phaeus]|uniref:hypothetical protein n=1 Tax=Siccirubricoccus phaeus TaxID=2595053 RepID=UPI0011F2ADD3|nr:hypothetical protein [Siccirubricoccus phaeus]